MHRKKALHRNKLLIAVGGVLLWTGFALRANRRKRRAETAFPPEGQFLDVEGMRVHYLLMGGGPPVVLLHGSDGFLQDYTQTIAERLAKEYTVLVLDRPGHGASSVPDQSAMTPEGQMRVLRAVLSELNIERPLLVAHSWGSVLALLFALEQPEETAGLVLLAPWIYPDALPGRTLLQLGGLPGVCALLHPIVDPFKEPFIQRELVKAFYPAPVPSTYSQPAAALWLRTSGRLAAFCRENTSAMNTIRRISPEYSTVSVPVVIVTGDRDAVVAPGEHAFRLHREVPASRLHVLPGIGHVLLHRAPEVVIAALAECRDMAGIAPAEGGALVRRPTRAEVSRSRARDLVMRYGWNSASYQILNPDLDLWFTPDGEGCVGYVCRYGVRVVAGAPVCALDQLAETVAAFEREAEQQGERVCYFGAAERLRAVLLSLPSHTGLEIGAQPAWNPAHWPSILKAHRSLRAQLNRARNKRVVVEEADTTNAAGNKDLQRCFDEWHSGHDTISLHFLTEPVPLDSLADRRLFVAAQQGTPVGFLVATPVPDRNGWLVEQIVRGRAAPNGTAELLIDGAMRALAASEADYVTLGLAPLSRRATAGVSRPALWLRLLLAWTRAHGTRFYNFEGLDAFKAKFQPDTWEPIFAIVNESSFSVRVLYALAAAFTNESPFTALSRALFSALRQEWRWLRSSHPDSPN